MITAPQPTTIFKNLPKKSHNQQASFCPYKTQNFRTKPYKPGGLILSNNRMNRSNVLNEQNCQQTKTNWFLRAKNDIDDCNSPHSLLKKSLVKNQKNIETHGDLFRKTFCVSKLPSHSLQQKDLQRPPTSQVQKHRPATRIRKISNIGQESNNNFLAKYQILKQLGKGTYGTVYLARIKNTNGINDSTNKDPESFTYNKPITRKDNLIQETQLQNKKTLQVDNNLQTVDKTQQLKTQQVQIQHFGSQFQDEKYNKEQLVAIKVYEKFKMNKDPSKFKNIRKEITIMQNLHHEGIIKLYESVQSLTKICLVVEYGGRQSLLDYLKRNYPLNQQKIKNFAKQLLDILIYLHDKNIVHRDIKPQNILIKEDPNDPNNLVLKLIDFGFSTLTNKTRKLNAICGTPNFMAPELLSSKEYFGQMADVWSYGVVVFVMAEGRHPFKSSQYQQLQRIVNKGKYSFKRKHSTQFQQFVSKILRVNSSQRPTVLQISNFKWLR